MILSLKLQLPKPTHQRHYVISLIKIYVTWKDYFEFGPILSSCMIARYFLFFFSFSTFIWFIVFIVGLKLFWTWKRTRRSYFRIQSQNKIPNYDGVYYFSFVLFCHIEEWRDSTTSREDRDTSPLNESFPWVKEYIVCAFLHPWF